MKGNTVAKHAHKYNKSAVMRDRKKDAKKGKVKHKGRDYAKEYANYHSRPEQIKRRAARNAARRAMRGRKELTDEKDVHHKDNNPMNNDKSNLSIVTQHYNRREPRLRVEDLRKWFGKGKKGDWVRVGTDGEIKGDCAREPGEGKPKCMPRSKAHSMSKKDRASSARRKRRADPSVDRPGTGNKPIMVKTDKKESVVHEDVNVKSIDKFKAAARDFDKNKDINFKSIADALSRIVTAVRMLDKSTSGRTDYKYEQIISKESTRINNIVNKLNYGKGGATPEGKEIVKLLNKHGLNRPFRTIIFEGVEMNEQFVVKYAKNKRGPIYQTKFSTQGEAEKFLAQKRKEGMNGIVSKAGKPVSMQKMKDMQKESIDENKIFFVKVGDGRDSMTVKTKARNSREALKKMRSEHPKSRVSLDINQKQGQPAGALESVDLEEGQYSANFTDHTPNKDFNDLAKKHRLKVTHDKKSGSTTVHGDKKSVHKHLHTMYGKDWKHMYKKKGNSYVDESVESVELEEKNVPTNPALWSKIKSQAKAKFDVYPSAYANGWAAKQYKAAGGGWKTESVKEMKSFWDIREGAMSKDKETHDTGGFRISNKDAQAARDRLKARKTSKEATYDRPHPPAGIKSDEKPPFVPNRKVGVKKDKFGNVVKDKNRAKHLAKLAMRGEDK